MIGPKDIAEAFGRYKDFVATRRGSETFEEVAAQDDLTRQGPISDQKLEEQRVVWEKAQEVLKESDRLHMESVGMSPEGLDRFREECASAGITEELYPIATLGLSTGLLARQAMDDREGKPCDDDSSPEGGS